VTLADDPEQYGEIRIFSPHGRIGRVRYIGYTTGLSILMLITLLVPALIAASASPSLGVLLVVAAYVAIYVVQILLSIQRAHDMNTSGWLSLLIFVPLAVFVFWFAPGTPGENRYGKPPPPNTTGAIVLACLPLPLIAFVGMMAAIAIPAYEDYTTRAQVSEGLNLAAAPKVAVVETFQRYGTPPADRADAGLSEDATDTAGRYVDSVDVAGGTVVVTYRANANAAIAGRVLALQPYVMPDDSVVWRCGHAAPPADAVAMDTGASSAGLTQIEPRHLPSACRP
jgi:uncharacterized membrane protein YhaH (DUF805 family)/Tfp pilus assembly major pilin PilA